LTQYLASTAVVLLDSRGKTLAQGKGSDILGHPLNAVIWLVNDLAKQGKRLKKGDLVSLGSFNPPLKPEAGQEITVSYPGVPGLQRATVRFESPDLHFATISRNHPMDALGA
jgi:2-keto-4-pentenoate hydratase